MRDRLFSRVAAVVLLSVLGPGARVADAAHSDQHQVVDGVSIYVGMVPGEMFGNHPKAHPEGEMHGGAPAGTHVYHLVIALFDESSGRRISDAAVSASISETNHPGKLRKLEPMLLSGTIVYGNYFDLPGGGPYRIVVRIAPLGTSRPIETEFVFGHART